jgi:hypothetical protein
MNTQMNQTKPAPTGMVVEVCFSEYGSEDYYELTKQGWRITDVHEEGDKCLLMYQKYLM